MNSCSVFVLLAPTKDTDALAYQAHTHKIVALNDKQTERRREGKGVGKWVFMSVILHRVTSGHRETDRQKDR